MDAQVRTALDRLATAITVGSVAWWAIVVVDVTVRDQDFGSGFWSKIGYVAAVSSWAIVMAFIVAIVLDLANPRVARERVLGVAASVVAIANLVAALGLAILDKPMVRSSLSNRVEGGALYV